MLPQNAANWVHRGFGYSCQVRDEKSMLKEIKQDTKN